MSDIALIWDAETGAADFAIEANDLAIDDGLQTAVLLSLFLDAPAQDGDVLPEGETDRRGWWGDSEGDHYGSRLWLLDRAKATQETLDRAEEFAREALQWLLTDRVAESLVVTASFPRVGAWGLEIEVHRPSKDPATYKFDSTWLAQAGE